MKYDDILQVLGGFGLYQKIILMLMVIPICFDGALTMLVVFLLGEPEHRCRLPDVEDDSYSITTSALNATKYNTSRCFLYINSTEIPCNKWVYDTLVYTSTLVTKFDMVCQNKVYSSIILSAHFLGTTINALLCGLASDRYGRKPVYIGGVFMVIVPNLIRPWIPNLFLVGFCQFVYAGGSYICQVVPFIIATEMVDPSHRVFITFTTYVCFCLGMFLILLYAYFIRDWETLILCATAPMAISFFIFVFVPESPRWLLSKGKTEKTIRVLDKMAKYNRIDMQFDLQDITLSEEYVVSTSESFKIIIKSKEMLKRFLILSFNWFTIILTYYSISMNTGELGGDPYIDYLLSTSAEITAILCCFFAERFPRKKLFCLVMIIGGATCISTIFTSIYGGKSSSWLTVTLAIFGKLGISAALFVAFLITTEVFPTVIRATAFGFCNTIGRVGGIVSAYVMKPGVLFDAKYGMGLPLLICGLFAITGGLLTLFLPETRKTELPDSVKEVLSSKSNFSRLDETTYLKASTEGIEMCSVSKDE